MVSHMLWEGGMAEIIDPFRNLSPYDSEVFTWPAC